MSKSRAVYMREYRERKNEEKSRTKRAEPKKVVRNSTQRNRDFRARKINSMSSIPTASTSTAIPNNGVNNPTLISPPLTFDMSPSTSSAFLSDIQPSENAAEEIQIQSYRIKKEEELEHPKIEESIAELFPIDISVVKKEEPCFEPSEQSIKTESNDVEYGDHLIYGNYIASRMRFCNRPEQEICLAKEQIDLILSSLAIGFYKIDISADDQDKKPVVQSIKTEPDL